MALRSLRRAVSAAAIAASVLTPLAMAPSSVARADSVAPSVTTIHITPDPRVRGVRPVLPNGISPLTCSGPARFQGPFSVGSTGAQFYLTDNNCGGVYYFQVQLYVPGGQSWQACDNNSANGYTGCNPANSTSTGSCNPCYSPGQVDSPGNMIGSAVVSGVQVGVGPI